MNRKRFIRQTSLLAGGLLLHQQMLKAYSSDYTGERISIGVIGCGDRGKGIIEVMQQIADKFSIKAACDILDFRIAETKKLDKQNSFTYYKDYKRLLDDRSIQAVIIAVPLHLHYIIATDSLRSGKHVYLEKTMTYNSQQALNLVATAKKVPKQILQIGHQYRYTPLYFKVKEMIQSGYIGKVSQIDCRWDRNWNWRRPVPEGYTDRQINWRMYKEYSGGLAAELLSHQIDFINWAFETHPDEIYATGGIDFYKDGRETFDNVQAVLRYDKNGIIGNFGATCSNEREGYIFRIKGSKGTVSLLVDEGIYYPEKREKKELELVDGVSGATKIEWNKEGGIHILKEKTKDGTWYALEEFYKAIMEKGEPVSNVTTGATTSFCVDMINRSSYNRTIELWKPEYNL
ncbi:MAG TPA: Gfo/Idh/MocA family oxidoreductase [Chitinophagaceae bacterium]|nr:Gfo/Idh/MocA family oxidoreductase [Chitinophagaceae bacterium]